MEYVEWINNKMVNILESLMLTDRKHKYKTITEPVLDQT